VTRTRVGLAEHHGVLQGLVFAFRDRERHDVERLAEIVNGTGQYQVCRNVLDEQQARVLNAVVMQGVVTMPRRDGTPTGGDGAGRDAGAAQPLGIPLGLEVARDGGNGKPPGEARAVASRTAVLPDPAIP